jgi:cellulose biosynthesis protein BcsQ
VSMTPPDRRVITFYSYKGGVGRTMALANVAHRLANTHGLRVVVVDWDLEAPGLHRYFGISPEVAAETQGILDYFLAWSAAVKRDDPEPPPEARDITRWIVPVEDDAHKPKFGSVSVLLAGKQDKTYDKRLAGFDWRDFYADAAGAVAVEMLRAQLVERADVVLVDSRTGLTDAGGICVVQIPDGVLLLTAPNEQSLEGTTQIARTIARASGDARAQRGRARVWLAMARVPSVEESYLAQEWFDEHGGWFEKGVEQDLWLKGDHPEGIQSLELPHTARWAFGERVLGTSANVGPRDPLALAYERLTDTLLRWVRGEPALSLPLPSESSAPKEAPQDIASLEAEALEAERRGDVLGLALTLTSLSRELVGADRIAEAISKLEQASGIFLSRGARRDYVFVLLKLGPLLAHQDRYAEAATATTRGVEIARELGDRTILAASLCVLALIKKLQGEPVLVEQLLAEASELTQSLGESAPAELTGLVSRASRHGLQG